MVDIFCIRLYRIFWLKISHFAIGLDQNSTTKIYPAKSEVMCELETRICQKVWSKALHGLLKS